MSLLGYWSFDKTLRNYGSAGYGSSLVKSGNYLVSDPIRAARPYYSFEANASGKLLECGQLSFGLMNLKTGALPYVKIGPDFHKPDNRFATSGANWSIYYRDEEFGTKTHTLSIYRNNQDIYTNGVDDVNIDGNLFFCPTGIINLRLYDGIPIDPVFAPNIFQLFGASGSIGSGFPLIMGTINSFNSSGMPLTMGAYSGSGCYLYDELGNVLYDELGDILLPESDCPVTFGYFAGFDMYISGQAFTEFILPLYLGQSSTSYSLTSGIPLTLLGGGNPFSNSINLTVYNNYGSIESGIRLSINGSGDNDGYIPIGSGFPLYIARNENTYFDLFISGTVQGISGTTNLYLNANTYPVSGIMNLSIPNTYGLPNSGMYLYSAGY